VIKKLVQAHLLVIHGKTLKVFSLIRIKEYARNVATATPLESAICLTIKIYPLKRKGFGLLLGQCSR
jgi:hypothetical protein